MFCASFFLTISMCFAFQKTKKILSIDLKIQFALIYVRKLSTKNLYTSISKYKIARYIKERLFYNIQHRFSHHIQMSILLVQSNFDYSICFENRHLYMTFIYINSFKISMQISLQSMLFRNLHSFFALFQSLLVGHIQRYALLCEGALA